MKKIFLTTKYFFTFYFAFSILTFAENNAFNPNTFKPVGALISSFTDNVVKGLMTMFGAAALTVFVYGIVLFIGNQASGGAKLEEGKKFMLWGLIALFVMISVWGIILMFQSLVGINKNDNQVNIKPICISGVNCTNDSNESTPANQAKGQPCRSERLNGFYDSDGNCVPTTLPKSDNPSAVFTRLQGPVL